MPVVGIPLDELQRHLGREVDDATLEHELHRFGCSVEGWATLARYRCSECSAVLESVEHEEPPAACEACGADLKSEGRRPAPIGSVRVLRMELLAVRPDLFDATGLARALRGFLGLESGAPGYALEEGPYSVDVDPALEGPEVRRPRIVAATVHGLSLDDAGLRALMKLQENIHWALGRDRKLASIGVYDLARVAGRRLRYRAAGREELSFVPLGFDAGDAANAMTPARILEQHPKGRAFARLLAGFSRVPLLEDEEGGVLSMPPIINSEATKVTTGTRDVVIDVTGLADRHIEKALNIVVTSLLELCPGAKARSVELRYAEETRRTPDLAPQEVPLDPADAGRLIGVPWSRDEVATLLGRMRHDVAVDGDALRVSVPAWRADVLHPRDLYEDAAIAFGYDNLPVVSLEQATYGGAHPREELLARARAAMVGQGFLEVMTLALSSEKASFEDTRLEARDEEVRLEHPISVEQTMVRVSTLPGLMETLAVNLTRPYPQRICETGLVSRVAPASETGALESPVASLALAGDGFGYADVRSAVDALLRDLGVPLGEIEVLPSDAPLFMEGRGAEVRWQGRRLGLLGEVHPAVLERSRIIHPVALAEIELEAL